MKINFLIFLFYSSIFSQLLSAAPLHRIVKNENIESDEDSRVLQIVPTRKYLQSLDGNIQGNNRLDDAHERVLRQSYLDLSELVGTRRETLPATLDVQIYHDEESIVFQNMFGSVDRLGFYWYGESDKYDSSFSIQVHGRDCMG